MDETLLHDLVGAALKAGADAAEAVFANRRALSVTVRMGELEEVEREESRDIGLRVFVGQRQATVSGSDISADARAKLVDRAVAMARLAPEDPYAGFAPDNRLASGPFANLQLYDKIEPSAEQLEERARIAEEAARGIDGVTNTDGGTASWSTGEWRLVTSAGFEGPHRTSAFSLSASAIAGEGSEMERGGEGRTTRWSDDLPVAEAIPAEPIARRMTYVAKWPAANWTLAFQGNVHEIGEGDYELIRQAIEAAAKVGTGVAAD